MSSCIGQLYDPCLAPLITYQDTGDVCKALKRRCRGISAQQGLHKQSWTTVEKEVVVCTHLFVGSQEEQGVLQILTEHVDRTRARDADRADADRATGSKFCA